MGCEFGQRREWNYDAELEWGSMESPLHGGVQRLVGDLNRTYRASPALHVLDCDQAGFEWIDCNDAENSTLSLLRRAPNGDVMVAAFNFTPIPRSNHRVGVPRSGTWNEVLNTDATVYGGSGQGNLGAVESVPLPAHGRLSSLVLTLPPLAGVFLVPAPRA